MKLIIDGNVYSGFVSGITTFRMDALSDQFSIKASQVSSRPLPFTMGSKCTVTVDDSLVLTGYVERVEVTGGALSHEVSISGRDLTSDLVDSSIAGLATIQVAEETTLKQAIQAVLDHLGSSLLIEDEVKPEAFKRGEDILIPKPGVNAFEFLHKIARKRQVFLTSTPKGAIKITRGSVTEESGGFLQHVEKDSVPGSNNILTYQMSYDESELFYQYKNVAQSNAFAWIDADLEVDADLLANNKAKAVIDVDMAHRPGRQMVSVGKDTEGAINSFNRAEWEANIRRARARSFRCTVSGFRNQAGDLWSPNTLVSVDSDYAGIHASMLIISVSFSLDSKMGSITSLVLVEKGTYSIVLDERDKKKGSARDSAIFGGSADPTDEQLRADRIKSGIR